MLSVLTFRTPDEAVEKANNTPYGLSRRRLDGEGLADPLDGAAAARRRRLGEHVQPVRPGVAVRRLQGIRLRPRGRAARARAVPGAREWTPASARVRKTYKLLHRRASSRAPSRAAPTRPRARTSRAASRKDAARRGAAAARRAARVVAATTAYNRGQVLYRVAEMMEARRGRVRRALLRARSEVERSIDRVVWYAGWADKLAQVLGSSNPVAAPYFNFTVPEPTGVVGILAPEEPALRGLVSRARARRSSAATRSCRRLGSAPARGDRAGRGARHERTSRAASSTSSPGDASELAPVLASHMDVNALDVCRRRRRGRRSSSGSRPRTSSASCAARRTTRARGRSRPSSS